jgi:hypothetical protein
MIAVFRRHRSLTILVALTVLWMGLVEDSAGCDAHRTASSVTVR